MKYVQFSSISSLVLRGKVSEREAWKDESRALLETDCDWWELVLWKNVKKECLFWCLMSVSSRQLELQWRSSAFREPSCSGSGNEKIDRSQTERKIKQWWTIYLADSRIQPFHDLHLPHSPLSLYSRSLSPPLLIPSLKRKSHKYNRGFGEHCELFNIV